MTFIQRQISVDYIDVDAPLYKRHVPAGSLFLTTKYIYEKARFVDLNSVTSVDLSDNIICLSPYILPSRLYTI